MALDTTVGGSASDSYGTAAEFFVFATSRGWSTPDTAEMEPLLRRAADYIDNNYGFVGRRANQDQALAWPRFFSGSIEGYALPSDTIPEKVVRAQFVLAYLLSRGETVFDTVSTGAVVSKRSKAGPVETQTTYNANTQRTQALFTEVRARLSGYITADHSSTWGNGRIALG